MSQTPEKQMSIIDAVMVAEGVTEAACDQQIAAWQLLHDTGTAYKLQGWFGRAAQQLIEQGVIKA